MDQLNSLPTIQEGLASYESDYYAVLGISMNADETEIKEVYSNQTKKLQIHAQKNYLDSSIGNQILKHWLQPAYSILTDSEQRFEYEAILKQRISRIHPQEIKELWPRWRRSSPQDRDPNWVDNYNKAVRYLSDSLYSSLENLANTLAKLSHLNLDYLLMSFDFDINIHFEDVWIQNTPIEPEKLNPISSRYPLQIAEIETNLPAELLPDSLSGETRFKQSLQMVARGQYKDAIQFLSFAISQDPGQSTYYALRGIAYHRQGFRGMAKADYHRAWGLEQTNKQQAET